MRRTALALAAVTVGAALTGAASANTGACNLLTDNKGDAGGFLVTDPQPLPSNPQLDIVSADIASDAKSITAVVRLDALTTTDSMAPTGRTYYVNFFVGEKQLFLAAALDSAGAAEFSAGHIATTRSTLGPATGVVDTANKQVRITAPISQFAAQAVIKPGVKITDLNALAQRYIGQRGVGGATPTADTAAGGSPYVAGSKSCVKVGK